MSAILIRSLVSRRIAFCSARSCSSAAKTAHAASSNTLSLPEGFLLDSVKDVPEYDMTLYSMRHARTGAQFYYFNRDDQNCTFCVQLRTVPQDSTGVAHILEHLALCGSKNFPCPEPFFKMLTRSMATFMNAMTGPDLTMYPFATQNKKDFENLLRVYLDAAFFPNLEYLDFRQEGWRLDMKKGVDESTPIRKAKGMENVEFSGVVFNEMKGAMSQLPSLVDHTVRSLLLPSNTYKYNFGGDPLEIINLTHEHLKNFHSTFYHPSNAKFVLYGDFPVERWLGLVDELVLKKFEKLDMDSRVASESRWSEPKTKVAYFQQSNFDKNNPREVEAAKRQTVVTCAFLISDITDVYHVYCWNILSYLLTSGPAAPFHKSLIQSELGANFSPVTGFESDTRDCYFSVGASNVANDDPDKVLKAIDETIEKVIEEGFDQQRIDSVLHLIELDLKHQKANFGINLVMGSASKLNHECDIQSYYSISEIFDRLRSDIKNDPNFFQNLVTSGLKKNSHRLNLIMKPKEDYFTQLQMKEDMALVERLEKLEQKSKDKIVSDSAALLEKQNLVADPSSLPKLLVTDIERNIIKHPSEIVIGYKNMPPTQVNVQPTNGICYFNSLFSTASLNAEERIFLPIFCSVITKLGADSMNFEQLRSEIDLCSGGFSVSPCVSPHPENPAQFEETVQISSHALMRNVDKMFALWSKVLTSPDFEAQDYLKVILKERAELLQLTLEQSGHRYAMKQSASGLNAVCFYNELFSGITHVMHCRQIAQKMELDHYVNLFKNILSKVFNSDKARCSLNVQDGHQTTCLESLSNLFSNMNSGSNSQLSQPSPNWMDCPALSQQASRVKYLFPFQVSYTARSLPGVPYCHPDFAPLEVLSKLLSWNYLHQEIREKGGAYGAGASNSSSGSFTFYTYRDPTPSLSQMTFANSTKWLSTADLSSDLIDGAKLSVFQAVDAPVAPGGRNLTNFFTGVSDEMRQQRRDRLFRVAKNDLIDAAEKYLTGDNLKLSGAAVIGPENEDTKKIQWPVVTAVV